MDLRRITPYILIIQLVIVVILLLQMNTISGSLAEITGDVVIDSGDSGDTGDTAGTGDTGDSGDTAVDINIDGDPYMGADPDDAKVIIVEFSDFQCPYCQRGAEIIAEVMADYGDEVSLVFKDFPLSFHEYAQTAGEAAECAHEQDMFWEYHDLLFANQNSISPTYLTAAAEELGLDMDDFENCMDTGATTSEVRTDYGHGVSAGVRGTPGFFINGKLTSGAQPYEVFEAEILQYL